ncbi:DoxX family protein [Corynebacterium godavarianum]|uniref:DoxX family protein n=1 Tax=Corynebacterium godavarianum TaxID=2054421 RepID=A0ABY3DY86_9CORY|nr:DoxX family protein [Corynebacterium godavarianum]MBL7285843.1 DoxX family protein [Corynebacterium godavarianum]TSJ71082.1 DoxX family protein [Corynebacterium godavarianum]
MIRKIARPMLASVYIIDGVETALNPASHKDAADSALKKVRSVLPRQYRGFLPKDPETAAQIVGGVKAGAGSLFAIGKMPRTSASLLALSTVPSLIGRNAFWEADDEDDKARRRTGALTDVALAGGVLLATVDTAGKPGLQWRAQNAAKVARKNVQQALPTQSETEKTMGKASDWLSDTTDQVTSQVSSYVDDNKDDWKKAASHATEVAGDWFEDAKKQTSKFLAETSDRAQDAYKDFDAEKLIEQATPSKLEKFQAKRKVHGVVGDLQGSIDDLRPSPLEKLSAKHKVKKNHAKLEKKAQGSVDKLQAAFDKLDADPSWIQKLKWKRKAKKAEKRAKKSVKKLQKKLG